MSESVDPQRVLSAESAPLMNPADWHMPAASALAGAMHALMRGEHMPAAVEARDERDRARSIAARLEQENAELRRILDEILADGASARMDAFAALKVLGYSL